MLVTNYNLFKKFLPSITMKGGIEPFMDSLEIAQDRIVNDIIGEALEAKLEKDPKGNEKLLRMVQRAISVDAFLSSIPELDLVLTDAGFAVAQNEKVAPASTARVQALTGALQLKLDGTKDAIVTYMMTSGKYDDWRATPQFERLSDGLIFTFAEFKDVAVINNASMNAYPKTWQEFILLNPALNTALMTSVASYISRAYAEEIIEKLRDKEEFLPNERKVIKVVKTAMAAYALGDDKLGEMMSVRAAGMMKKDIADFPTYASSAEFEKVSIKHSDTPIFSMF